MSLTANVPGLQELSTEEMQTTNGGFLPLLIVPVFLLLAGCATPGVEHPESAGSKAPPSQQ
jgi:hypothetical protein